MYGVVSLKHSHLMTPTILIASSIFIVATVLTIHTIYNFFACLKPSKKHAHPDAKHGLVTIMIPARNEEKVIEKCLRSLIAQDYPELEVIVYNDQSTDQTGHIADKIAKEDKRIHVIHGTHLPEGWVGKNHGCHQMSQKAQGNWMLFGDSDIVLAPDAISRSLATADEHGLEFLSFFPRFDNYSFWERAILPLFYFYLFAYLPMSKIMTSKNPDIVAANGSFILIKQSLYCQIGGHEAVKDKILEDVLMGRHIKGLGHKTGYGDGSELYSVHMYDTYYAIWEGFSKNAFSFFKWNYISATTYVIFAFLFLVVPFLLIPLGLLINQPLLSLAGLASSSMYLFMSAILNYRLEQGIVSVFMFPLAMFLSLAVIVNSMFRVATGKGLTWKGRSYAK
ncbi:MAG: hypothetical protein A2V81_02840 [Candidatus Abawacabacteria bacterium RBG_16_42_10]|uniref:Glycosyltransferase 2-like domain-containing protein n=1 Tax=Candidatus Abawacabacteria bacterium RBG_16_42_10 TaxID=1817814 RepID=A0A1F4XK34_9BACT|nr:MAG: hypothetical protein A2V81_02840 [Candidatus Abawacabacteria bacterium RBG_16_42_10]